MRNNVKVLEHRCVKTLSDAHVIHERERESVTCLQPDTLALPGKEFLIRGESSSGLLHFLARLTLHRPRGEANKDRRLEEKVPALSTKVDRMSGARHGGIAGRTRYGFVFAVNRKATLPAAV